MQKSGNGMHSYFEKANAQPISILSPTAASYIVGNGRTDILPLPLVVCPKDTGTDSKSSAKTNAQTQVTNEVRETHLKSSMIPHVHRNCKQS